MNSITLQNLDLNIREEAIATIELGKKIGIGFKNNEDEFITTVCTREWKAITNTRGEIMGV